MNFTQTTKWNKFHDDENNNEISDSSSWLDWNPQDPAYSIFDNWDNFLPTPTMPDKSAWVPLPRQQKYSSAVANKTPFNKKSCTDEKTSNITSINVEILGWNDKESSESTKFCSNNDEKMGLTTEGISTIQIPRPPPSTKIPINPRSFASLTAKLRAKSGISEAAKTTSNLRRKPLKSVSDQCLIDLTNDVNSNLEIEVQDLFDQPTADIEWDTPFFSSDGSSSPLEVIETNLESSQSSDSDFSSDDCDAFSDIDLPDYVPLLESFPSKLTASSSTSQNVQPSVGVASGKSGNKKSPASSPSDDEEGSRFLLSCLDDETLSPQEQEKRSSEDFNRNLFVQELFLSMLSDPSQEASAPKDDVIATSSREQAMPVECPVMASTPTTQLTFKVNENSKETMESEAPSKSMLDSSSGNNNKDTDASVSVCANASTDNSPVLFSLSTVSDQERARLTSGSSAAVSSRSAPVVASGDRRLISELPAQWHFHGDDNEKDSDDDKPPSPTPTMHRGLLLQGGRSVLLGGSHGVRLSGGASSISDYNRDEVQTGGSLSKHPR